MRPKSFVPRPLEKNGPYVRNETDGRVWHRCQTRVLYADTDRSGRVYHASYFRFFELGRTSLMRDTAHSYREIEAHGYIYPIIELTVTYHSFLGYDDPIFIYTSLGELGKVRLVFDYVIIHQDKKVLVCKGLTRHCAVSAKGKPARIDEKIRHLWKVFPK